MAADRTALIKLDELSPSPSGRQVTLNTCQFLAEISSNNCTGKLSVMTTTKKLFTCGGVVPKSVFGLSRQSNLIECKPS